MCKYCDESLMNDGANKNLVQKSYKAGVFGRLDLDMDIVVLGYRKPYLGTLVTQTTADRTGIELLQSEKEIHYCPMCGRKLD